MEHECCEVKATDRETQNKDGDVRLDQRKGDGVIADG